MAGAAGLLWLAAWSNLNWFVVGPLVAWPPEHAADIVWCRDAIERVTIVNAIEFRRRCITDDMHLYGNAEHTAAALAYYRNRDVALNGLAPVLVWLLIGFGVIGLGAVMIRGWTLTN
jgi:hypothetical protein